MTQNADYEDTPEYWGYWDEADECEAHHELCCPVCSSES